MSAQRAPTGWTDRIEETLIAAILGLMTIMTFANVVARYVFNSNIFYALEMTVFLFAWLVLLGASYAVKKTMHLGVDALVNLAGPGPKRALALFSVAICFAYAVLLLKAGWDYWAPYANLPPTTGRWFPTGFAEKFRSFSFYEVNDIPMIAPLRFLEPLINEGETYSRIPRAIPYIVMPISMALLTLRFGQVAFRVWRGHQELLIVSHEAEDEVEAAAAKLKETD